jgi:DNA-binding response OmpR family regulator
MTKGSRDLGSSVPCSEVSRSSNQRGIVKERERILVVEPNDLILGLLERWLGDADYEVSVASSLTRLKGMGESPPHLVIIDVPTPRTAQKMISSVREVFSSPILLLSGTFRRGASSSGYAARQLGVHKMLPKPFSREELLSAVSESIDTVN